MWIFCRFRSFNPLWKHRKHRHRIWIQCHARQEIIRQHTAPIARTIIAETKLVSWFSMKNKSIFFPYFHTKCLFSQRCFNIKQCYQFFQCKCYQRIELKFGSYAENGTIATIRALWKTNRSNVGNIEQQSFTGHNTNIEWALFNRKQSHETVKSNCTIAWRTTTAAACASQFDTIKWSHEVVG